MNDMSVPRLEPPVAQVERLVHGWRPEGCDRVALVLQGGGALGAYQALHESGIEPDWVSGVSIGAINAAIIAGNVPINVSAACGRSGS
jgi:NTE family protein